MALDPQKLARWMSEKNVSPKQLSEAANVGYGTIQRWMRDSKPGQPASCTPSNHADVAEALGLTMEQLAWKGESSSIPNNIDRFDTIIKAKTSHFAEGSRRFVFDKIENFRASELSGYFIIEGDPGAGKSTILAKLVQDHVCVRHFNVASLGIRSAGEFLRNICAQLLQAIGIEEELPPEFDKNGSYFRRLLERISTKSKGKKTLIAIDALDEADTNEQDPYSNILYLPEILPPWVHIVVTSRRLRNLRLVTSPAPTRLDLRDYPEENRNDVVHHIEHRMSNQEFEQQFSQYAGSLDLTVPSAIEMLVEKSECNFMYLHYILQEVSQHQGGVLELPAGLTGYYQMQLRRMRSLDSERLKVLFHLAVGGVAKTIRDLGKHSGVALTQVALALDDWHQFLRTESVGETQTYSIYHNSFREFLLAQPEVESVGIEATASFLDELGWDEEP